MDDNSATIQEDSDVFDIIEEDYQYTEGIKVEYLFED